MIKQQIRKIRAKAIRRYFKNPSKDMVLIGVTGTDGKSTTSEMLYQILKASGKSVGLISTIGGKINDQQFDTGLHTSTPSTFQIYKNLEKMHQMGVTYCVLELTSHGLDQYRAHGIVLEGCIITNITPEHLDYHKTFNRYRQAKAKIMNMVKPGGFVCINQNDANAQFLENYAKKKKLLIVKYETTQKDIPLQMEENEWKQYFATNVKRDDNGYTFDVRLSNITFPISINLIGLYNIQNALAAISAGVSLNLSLAGIVSGIQQVKNIKGRFNILQKDPFTVIVDFAHTPNAFMQILALLKQESHGRLITMFGCPGKRDHEKRVPMGKNASLFSDIIVITAEDPRDENFNDITKDILKGIDKEKFIEGKNLFMIESREEAIEYIMKELVEKNDTVALLGKGHEQSNCIGNVEYPWNEEEIALKYIQLYKKTIHV